MQLLQAVQLREWDQFSIREQQIESVDLMERAAQAAVDWITQRYGTEQAVYIFCGSGNNGGDGLAISRLLFQRQYQIFVYTLPVVNPSADWQIQLQRLTDIGVPATPLEQEPDFPCLHANSMVIDALYGTGLNRVITGITANLIQYLNASETRRIAIDIPSGLSCDQPILAPVMLAAQHTLTFQCLKRSFLFAETAPWVGEIHILDIQLSRRYLQQVSSDWQWLPWHAKWDSTCSVETSGRRLQVSAALATCSSRVVALGDTCVGSRGLLAECRVSLQVQKFVQLWEFSNFHCFGYA